VPRNSPDGFVIFDSPFLIATLHKVAMPCSVGTRAIAETKCQHSSSRALKRMPAPYDSIRAIRSAKPPQAFQKILDCVFQEIPKGRGSRESNPFSPGQSNERWLLSWDSKPPENAFRRGFSFVHRGRLHQFVRFKKPS